MEQPQHVALALGSGGARGFAHIGVIQVLQEWNIGIVSVAGSSMGALVGGMFAAGSLDTFTDWACNLTRFDVLRLLDVSFSSSGAIRAEKILAKVRELAAGALIEDLPIPFTAVASDLAARKAVWFQKGPLDVAIRASIAIPGVFAPVMLNGRVLVDGGLMDPVPIVATASSRADATIAVDLGGLRSSSIDVAPVKETAEDRPIEEWADRFKRTASSLFDRDIVRSLMSRMDRSSHGESPIADEIDALQSTIGADDPGPVLPRDLFETLPVGLGKFDVMNQSLEAMQTVLTRFRLAGNPPDVLITVPKDACRTLDFHRAPEMIELGRMLTIEALERAGIHQPEPIDS
ncbi:MAG: patatin-like phospholipase family protein [Ilumatobacteraceae bacterium]